MKKILYISAVALLAACTELPVDIELEKQPINPEAVTFMADIQSATRATDTAFDEGDEISVFATVKNNLDYSNYAQNVKYTYTDALFTTSDDLTYPDEDTYLSFYAIYPYMTYSTPDFTFSVNKDQSTNKTYTESDLMTASQVAKNQEVVELTFNHRMVKIVVNLNSKNLPAGDQEITFNNVQRTVKADLTDNTFKGSGALSEIIACPNGSNSFKALLPSQTIKKGTKFADIRIGDNLYTWTIENDLILTSGVEYTYTLTLKEGSIAFTSNINPWNSPSDMVSVIPQEYIDLLGEYIPIYEGDTPPNIEGVWLISPNDLYYDSKGGSYDNFADDYIWFYDQMSDNTLNMRSTQNLGDLSEAEGVFVSGSGNNFTVYFSEYYTDENGAWLISATLMSGTKSGSVIKNLRNAFVILDAYDPYDEYMRVGDFRVLEDGDYSSGQTSWPLDTRIHSSGKSKYASK